VVKTELVPHLRLVDGLYVKNALVKNCGEGPYIKIINMRDINERIIAPEVELEELDEIATNDLKNSNLYNKDIQTLAVNAIAIDNIQSIRSHSLREHLRLDYLNKKVAIHVDRIINKYNDLFRLLDVPLGHTDVIILSFRKNLSQRITVS